MASSDPAESSDVDIVEMLEQLDSLSFAVVVGVAAKFSIAFSKDACRLILTVAAQFTADKLSSLKTKVAKFLEEADPDLLDSFKDNLLKAHQAHFGVATSGSLRDHLRDVGDKFAELFEVLLEKKTKSKRSVEPVEKQKVLSKFSVKKISLFILVF